MSASALPSKLFFRIGEVAGLVGVEPHVLRYWEREFRSIRPTKSAKGQRVYSRKDVENLLRVRDLLYRDGFTIAGAKKRLQRGAVSEAVSEVAFDHEHEPAHEHAVVVVASAPDTETELLAEVDDDDEDVEQEDYVASSPQDEPVSGPRANGAARSEPAGEVRAKLTLLRAEIEGFLIELETTEHA